MYILGFYETVRSGYMKLAFSGAFKKRQKLLREEERRRAGVKKKKKGKVVVSRTFLFCILNTNSLALIRAFSCFKRAATSQSL